MYVPDVELHRADSIEQASSLLSCHGAQARILAGGTDLLVDLKAGRTSAKHLISLRGISELRGVRDEQDALRFGALTTISQLAASPLVSQHASPILDATRDMAAPQVRNMATVGGNIASAVPCADLPPILIALGASLVIRSSTSERTIPLESFFAGPRQTSLGPLEILVAILVPRMPVGFGAAYSRLSPRAGNSIAVASVAAGLHLNGDGSVESCRIVLGSVAPVPKRAKVAEAELEGNSLNRETITSASRAAMDQAEPISDVRGSADYRRRMVGVLTERALTTAHERATENGR